MLTEVFVQVFPLEKLMKKRNQCNPERVAVERRLLLELSHPYIVRGHSSFHEGDHIYICMEFASNGELWSHMYENDSCPLNTGGTALRFRCRVLPITSDRSCGPVLSSQGFILPRSYVQLAICMRTIFFMQTSSQRMWV